MGRPVRGANPDGLEPRSAVVFRLRLASEYLSLARRRGNSRNLTFLLPFRRVSHRRIGGGIFPGFGFEIRLDFGAGQRSQQPHADRQPQHDSRRQRHHRPDRGHIRDRDFVADPGTEVNDRSRDYQRPQNGNEVPPQAKPPGRPELKTSRSRSSSRYAAPRRMFSANLFRCPRPAAGDWLRTSNFATQEPQHMSNAKCQHQKKRNMQRKADHNISRL